MVPKKIAFPALKNTTRSANFFASRMSCVTTILVRCSCCFNRSIKSPRRCAIRGSTIVVGSSYNTASGCDASARAIAIDRFLPVDKSEGGGLSHHPRPPRRQSRGQEAFPPRHAHHLQQPLHHLQDLVFRHLSALAHRKSNV